MANVLKMATIEAIQQLHAAGWSQRRIAAELQIDRSTVARYLRPPSPDPKPAIPPLGTEAEIQPSGCEKPTVRSGRISTYEPVRELILAKVREELSAQRIRSRGNGRKRCCTFAALKGRASCKGCCR